jgi:hypothetical protein
MSADVRDAAKGADPRSNGKDQRDEKHDLFWRFQSRHVAPCKNTWPPEHQIGSFRLLAVKMAPGPAGYLAVFLIVNVGARGLIFSPIQVDLDR